MTFSNEKGIWQTIVFCFYISSKKKETVFLFCTHKASAALIHWLLKLMGNFGRNGGVLDTQFNLLKLQRRISGIITDATSTAKYWSFRLSFFVKGFSYFINWTKMSEENYFISYYV